MGHIGLAVNIALKYLKEHSRKLRKKGPYIAFDRNTVFFIDVYTYSVQMMEEFQSTLISLKNKYCLYFSCYLNRQSMLLP